MREHAGLSPAEGEVSDGEADTSGAHRESDSARRGAGRRFAVVVSRFNGRITERLLQGAVETLVAAGASRREIEVFRVPGAWELPQTARRILAEMSGPASSGAGSGGYHALIALGCVIRGETPHFEYVAGTAARGLGAVALDSEVPVIFGVLTTDTVEQAEARSAIGESNKGREAALAALEMAELFERIGAE